ncbi:MAG TPA: tyrosine-type recombinase/integrase [Terriglobales bacterium]
MPNALTVRTLVVHYRREKMPQRASTRRGYEGMLRNYILPKWQDAQITELQARPVELWIQSLKLAPKTKVHIRGLIRTLWDYAMWRGNVPTQRNPMELVVVKNASKRVTKPRTMTIEEFQRLSAKLTEPYRTMAAMAVCLGLRWSELVGLKWQDINWIDRELSLQRAVVKQIEDEVKTVHSSKPLALESRILDLLKEHRQNSVFTSPGDWVFASPEKHGKLPRSYTSFWEKLGRGCQDAGILHVSPHSFRHSYRAWLDEVGTPITVQQRAMRHGDIRVTMSYGEIVGSALREATAKVAARAIPNEQQTERKESATCAN